MDIQAILGAIVSRLNPTPEVQPVALAGGYGAVVVAHKDYQIVAQPGPKKPGPDHRFADLEDLARWLLREDGEGRWFPADATILVGQTSVQACVDDYTQHPATACCPLGLHPYWQAWANLAARGYVASSDLLEALREIEPSFAPEVVTVDGSRQEIPGGGRILAALRSLSVGDESGASVERDAGGMARVQARSGKVTTSSTIPERWTLRLPAFDAAPDLVVDLEALVSWRHDRDAGDLVFRVRLPLAPIALREARQLVVGRLRELLEGWSVGAGEIHLAAPRLD